MPFLNTLISKMS